MKVTVPCEGSDSFELKRVRSHRMIAFCNINRSPNSRKVINASFCGCDIIEAGPVNSWILGVRHADGCSQHSSLKILHHVAATHAKHNVEDFSCNVCGT